MLTEKIRGTFMTCSKLQKAEAPRATLLQRRGSIFISGKKYWKWVEGVFWIRVSISPKASARALETERRESSVGLFQCEERAAPERHIIDTSEWARANCRCVMG